MAQKLFTFTFVNNLQTFSKPRIFNLLAAQI